MVLAWPARTNCLTLDESVQEARCLVSSPTKASDRSRFRNAETPWVQYLIQRKAADPRQSHDSRSALGKDSP